MADIVISCSLHGTGNANATDALGRLAAGLDPGVIALAPATLKVGRKRSPIAKHGEIAAIIAGTREGSFSMKFDGDRHAFFDGNASASSASLNLGCPIGSPLAGGDAPTAMHVAMVEFARRESDTFRFGGYSGLSVRNLDFPRQRPPRDYLVAGQTNLVDIVDVHVVGQGDAAHAARIFSEATLPADVKRSMVDGIAIIDWSGGVKLTDETGVAHRLSLRDGWLARHKAGRPAEGWTERGDAVVDPLGAQPRGGLTLYSPTLGIGYVAIHSALPPDRRKSLLEAAGRMRANGRTETGESLAHVIVIADTREAAIALRAEATEYGLEKVVYSTDEHVLDPFPEGRWAELPQAGP